MIEIMRVSRDFFNDLWETGGAVNAEVLWTPGHHPIIDLPVSTSIVPRPVLARRLRRLAGEPIAAPSELEQQDAVRILEEFHDVDCMRWLYAEAERVFCEASS